MGEAARIELTEDLAEYARKSAAKEARKRCPPSMDWDEIAQEAVFRLIRCPPKFDPTRGASKKTLIYIAVRCLVIKSIAREYEKANQFKQAPIEADSVSPTVVETGYIPEDKSESAAQMLSDLLEHVQGEENQQFVRAYVKCGGNASETARRIGRQ